MKAAINKTANTICELSTTLSNVDTNLNYCRPNIVNGFVFVISLNILKYCWVARDVMAAMLVGRYKRILYYMLLYQPRWRQ